MSTKVTITKPDGKKKTIKVNQNDTIEACKKISGDVPAGNYKWIFNGDVLENDKTVSFYEIEDDDNIICDKVTPGGEFLNKIKFNKNIYSLN